MTLCKFEVTCSCGWSKTADPAMLATAITSTMGGQALTNAFLVALLAGNWAEHLHRSGGDIPPVSPLAQASRRHVLTMQVVG